MNLIDSETEKEPEKAKSAFALHYLQQKQTETWIWYVVKHKIEPERAKSVFALHYLQQKQTDMNLIDSDTENRTRKSKSQFLPYIISNRNRQKHEFDR